MKKVLALGLALIFVVCTAIVAIAADDMYSLKGPVVSVDAGAKTVVVHCVEGVTTKANNRWIGDVTVLTDDMTKISMHKKMVTLNDLKAGQNLKVKFHEVNGKPVAVEIRAMSGKKAK